MVTFGPNDASEVTIGEHGSVFSWRGHRLELNLPGRFNVTNAIGAAAAAWELGIGWEAISIGLASVPPVRGRFEAVDEGQPFTVLVDFAHTPAALAEALRAARELTASGPGSSQSDRGRVILVFGAGGNRDRAKRPLMGQVAAELADVVVITSDNPRDERPLAIIEAGGQRRRRQRTASDRRRPRPCHFGRVDRPPSPATWSSSLGRATKRARILARTWNHSTTWPWPARP